MKKVTVKAIAEELNLSVGTVYRSLNNTGRVSEKTKRRVLEYVEKVGFQPNVIAQGLAKRHKYRILALIPREPAEWWDLICAGLNKAAQELSEFGVEVIVLRQTCLIGGTLSQTSSPIGLMKILKDEPIDGMILVPSIHREILEAFDFAKSKNIPVACINADSSLLSQRLFYYGPDEEQVGYMAGELLGKLVGGAGNICLVGIDSEDFYRLALRKKGLFNQLCRYYPNVRVLHEYAFPQRNLRSYLDKMITENHEELSAIYVYDSIALADTALVLKEHNIRTISIVGHECLSPCEQLIEEDWISATLCQETFSQGYYPLKLLYNHLLTHMATESFYYSNVNLVFRSNLNRLKKNENGCGFQ